MDYAQDRPEKQLAVRDRWGRQRAIEHLPVVRRRRADSLLPVVTLGNVVTLQVIAAREAQERRMHGRQLLHEVDAIAVLAIVIGGRKQRNKAQPQRPCVPDCKYEMVGRRWLDRSCLQRKPVLLPLGGEAGNGSAREGLIIHVGY